MKRNTVIATVWTCAVMVVVWEPTLTTLASTRQPAVRVENGLVVNSRAGYFFALPAHWVLADHSKYSDLKVIIPGSEAKFQVLWEHAPADSSMYAMTLIMSLGSSSSGWKVTYKGGASVGGHPATEVKGTRTREGQAETEERTLVMVEGEYVYTIGSTVPQAEAVARGAEVDRMLSSFTLGKPPKPEEK